jgi:hypothetical protein
MSQIDLLSRLETAAAAPAATDAVAAAQAALARAQAAATAPVDPVAAAKAALERAQADQAAALAAQAAKPVEAAVVAPAADAALPAVRTEDDEKALQFLAQLSGGAVVASGSLSDAIAQADAAGLASHTFLTTTLKKGNWKEAKSCPPEIRNFMPAGDRDFPAIFLGYRIGMVAWRGAGTAGGDNHEPPVWSAVVPRVEACKQSIQLVERTISIGRSIQYTGADAKAKFDDLGRLTPEMQVLLWTKHTGFFLAIVSGYTPTTDSADGLKAVENSLFVPLTISVKAFPQVNPKATDPAKKNWTTWAITGAPAVNAMGAAMLEDWRTFFAANKMDVARTLYKFAEGSDYNGLPVDKLAMKLDEYTPLLRRGK